MIIYLCDAYLQLPNMETRPERSSFDLGGHNFYLNSVTFSWLVLVLFVI